MKPVVHRKWNRQTKTAVALLDSRDAANTAFRGEGGRWVLVCAPHNFVARHPVRRTAAGLLAQPLKWCRVCREHHGLVPDPTPQPLEPVETPVVPRRGDDQPHLDPVLCKPFAELVERQLPRVVPQIDLTESFTPLCPLPFSCETVEATAARFEPVFTIYPDGAEPRRITWGEACWMRARYVLYAHYAYGEVMRRAQLTLEASSELVAAAEMPPTAAG